MRQITLESFGRVLIREVRDVAVEHCDALFGWRGAPSEHWRAVAQEMSAEDAVRELIPDIVDHTLSDLLSAIDDGRLRISWAPPGSQPEDLTEVGLGELEGCLADTSQDGWLARFAGQRFHDYLEGPDVTIDPSRGHKES